jgi:DNA segregation ATPase FtsK/SpoIIIE-like protein
LVAGSSSELWKWHRRLLTLDFGQHWEDDRWTQHMAGGVFGKWLSGRLIFGALANAHAVGYLGRRWFQWGKKKMAWKDDSKKKKRINRGLQGELELRVVVSKFCLIFRSLLGLVFCTGYKYTPRLL